MSTSALWLFAHRGLGPELHRDPRGFVAALDGAGAPRFLEHLWTWAREHGTPGAADRPPLTYGIDRVTNGVIVHMRFRDVTQTGEPWAIRVVMKDLDPAAPPAYARMFLLEHSEYATEQSGKPSAIVCEAAPAGVHRNWGVVLAPDDDRGFDDAVFAVLKQATATPTAETKPGS